MVRLGMERQDVEQILGMPYDVADDPSAGVGRQVMTYTQPARWAYSYPMLWVHLTDGRVHEVYAKRYILWGVDDQGISSLSAPSEPSLDLLAAEFGR